MQSPVDGDLSFAILSGVASGILTTVVLVAVTVFFRRIVLPWYQTITYQGIILEGEWEIRGHALDQEVRVELKQRAGRLSGSCTFIKKADSVNAYEQLRTFRLHGTVNDRLVELSFRHTDRSRLGAGVWLLEVVGDGRRMIGVQATYSVSRDRVLSSIVAAARPGCFEPMKVSDSDVLTSEEIEALEDTIREDAEISEMEDVTGAEP